MIEHFDVCVIGGGPAGYHAAIRAAQLGLHVACVDAGLGVGGSPALGGTCLRIGCIPSKALLDSSKRYWDLKHTIAAHGIEIGQTTLNLATMLQRKDAIVQHLTGGIAALFKANKVTNIFGTAKLFARNRVEITSLDGQQRQLHAANVILAAGSRPAAIPTVPINGQTIVDSSGALAFDAVPRHLAVIGAGSIGLELGSVWRRLGAQVTLLDQCPQLLAAADRDVAMLAERELSKQGIVFQLGAAIRSAQVQLQADIPQVSLTYADITGEHTLVVDKVLVAVGRRPATEDLLGEGCAVQCDEQGRIVVDAHCHTGVEGVWAIGDCVRGPMLAHKGFEEGIAVAELIAGLPGHVNLATLPWVVYTEPELAWVGENEQSLMQQGTPYNVGMFPLSANGRAVAMGEPCGFIKVLAHRVTDRVLGMHCVGPHASELVHEGVLTLEFKGAADDLARICHAHPSLAEAIHDAAMAIDQRVIHAPNRTKRS